MIIKKLALTAASTAALGLGMAANAATVFTATLEESQSTTPGDAMGVFANAALTLNELDDGTFGLSMSVTFTDGIDWTDVIASGQINVIGTDETDGGVDATRFHIHNAPRGETGGVVFGIFDLVAPEAVADTDGDTTLTFDEDGGATLESEWDFTEGTGDATLMAFVTELLAARDGQDVALYFNFHTVAAPAGLIRGQIVGANDVGSEVPVPAAAFLFAPVALGGIAARRRKARA